MYPQKKKTGQRAKRRQTQVPSKHAGRTIEAARKPPNPLHLRPDSTMKAPASRHGIRKLAMWFQTLRPDRGDPDDPTRRCSGCKGIEAKSTATTAKETNPKRLGGPRESSS